MATLTINYDALESVAQYASRLSTAADTYITELSNKVDSKLGSLTGGATNSTSDASYYVNAKITALTDKKNAYSALSSGITNLISEARRIDQAVANAISTNHENFLGDHEHLRIDEWKADLLNWLVDLQNSCPLFDMIGNALADMGTAISDWMADIRYWYKCEGGKELLGVITAIGGAIVAIALFIASFPISSFVALCAMVGAAIAAVNAVWNVVTSCISLHAHKNGDPAWSKIYADQNKLSDTLRQTNYKNAAWNSITNIIANGLDTVELFCDAVNLVDAASKIHCIKHFFSAEKRGLLAYMKEPKYYEVTDFNVMKNAWETRWVMKTNAEGVVETHYTLKSVWNGMKAFVTDSPVDAVSDKGIRTLLCGNFKMDVTDAIRSYSPKNLMSNFKYNITRGGAMTVNEWKSTYSIQNLVDTARYNIKYGSFAGVFESGVEWKHRKTFITSSANQLRSAINWGNSMGQIVGGDSSISTEIEKKIWQKAYNFSDTAKVINKSGLTQIIGEKLNWKYTPSGVIQKADTYFSNVLAPN